MPNFEHDRFPLVLGQSCQRLHGFLLGRAFRAGTFEPAMRFKFTGQSPPQAAAVIQGAVPEGANAVMLRLKGRSLSLHERDKSLLQNVFGLAMAEPQRPAIQDQFGRFRPIERFTPTRLFLVSHSTVHWIDTKP